MEIAANSGQVRAKLVWVAVAWTSFVVYNRETLHLYYAFLT
jgi:hypothetical protein